MPLKDKFRQIKKNKKGSTKSNGAEEGTQAEEEKLVDPASIPPPEVMGGTTTAEMIRPSGSYQPGVGIDEDELDRPPDRAPPPPPIDGDEEGFTPIPTPRAPLATFTPTDTIVKVSELHDNQILLSGTAEPINRTQHLTEILRVGQDAGQTPIDILLW